MAANVNYSLQTLNGTDMTLSGIEMVHQRYLGDLNVSTDLNTGVYTAATAPGEYTEPRHISSFDEYKAAMWLLRYLLPVIVFSGSVGNVISFAVLMRKGMRNTSVNMYLAVMACADTGVLMLSAFKTWLRVVTGYELLHQSPALCKGLIFTFVLCLHLSAWCILLVTFDRFIVVWFPFLAATFCSYRRSRNIAIGMLTVAVGYNLHLWWTIHLQVFAVGGREVKQCAPLQPDTFMNGPYNYLKLATYSLVPFALVLIMNTGIIWRICYHSRQHSRVFRGSASHCHGNTAGANRTETSLAAKNQVTIMLLLVSFVWLLLTSPFTVMSLLPFTYPDTHSRAAVFLAKTLSFIFMYLNHSVNFILYCIAGKRFRKELVYAFKDCGSLIHAPWSNQRFSRVRTSARGVRSQQTPLSMPKPLKNAMHVSSTP